MMRKHHSVPSNGFGRDSRAELGDAPLRAGAFIDGEKAVWEASSDPERVDVLFRYLEAINRSQD